MLALRLVRQGGAPAGLALIALGAEHSQCPAQWACDMCACCVALLRHATTWIHVFVAQGVFARIPRATRHIRIQRDVAPLRGFSLHRRTQT
eukprot:10101493-Alexandrium_andersonii.AAC.1